MFWVDKMQKVSDPIGFLLCMAANGASENTLLTYNKLYTVYTMDFQTI